MMPRRFLIHFNEKYHIESPGAEWRVLDNPASSQLFFEMKEDFQQASVYFLQFEAVEQPQVLAAAKAILSCAHEVKIVRIGMPGEITEEALLNSPCVPRCLVAMEDEDFEDLAEMSDPPEMHPAQDIVNGVMYYGSIIQGQDKLITSEHELFSLAAAKDRDIHLLRPCLFLSRFRHEAVIDYFSGEVKELPDDVFYAIERYLKEHIYFSESETFDLAAVWAMGTYLFRAFRYYPYLHVNAEKGSGKTLLMELLAPIVFNGILMAQPTVATVIRLIEQNSATLFIDEAEGLSRGSSGANSQIKQILKTGFAKSGSYYIGDNPYRTYSPKCFAGINDLDDVLADRAITIKMLRKTSAEKVSLYRENPTMRARQMKMRDQLYLFGLRYGPEIAADYENEKPEPHYDTLAHLSNRAYDVWLPLFRIVCSFSGGELKARVFQSLVKLSQLDAARRRRRDEDENETGALLTGLTEVLPSIAPLSRDEDTDYFDPDMVYAAMVKAEHIPRHMSRKAFSRLIRRALEIESVPKAYKSETKRMYAFERAKLDEYMKRYSGHSNYKV